MNLRPVFDFGGVVFRWRPAQLVAQVWPHRARNAAECAQTVATLLQGYEGDWGRFDQGLLDEAELIAAVCERTGWSQSDMHELLAAVRDELQPQAEVVALVQQLGQLRPGERPCFLSNMPTPLVTHLRAHHPLAEWFEAGVFSSEERMCKPDLRLFERAAQRFGRPPQQLLLIDDHPINVEAARRAGWQAELFTSAQALREALKARGVLSPE
ncbi:putative hydrolase of the HAD superfamily [Inhella inkyongensis]|uniref:Putative hydrolase of the HAD superfamily n=1 Tax=Inhella inkyongensis TaxID=392593 RepID=A0A840S3B1_9BURK|nr:HAD family phosphatase [Inhella inkyongensis]MBB5203324.1 putative hydrolase of the HAD superfamily [Inhella inkyongensis]